MGIFLAAQYAHPCGFWWQLRPGPSPTSRRACDGVHHAIQQQDLVHHRLSGRRAGNGRHQTGPLMGLSVAVLRSISVTWRPPGPAGAGGRANHAAHTLTLSTDGLADKRRSYVHNILAHAFKVRMRCDVALCHLPRLTVLSHSVAPGTSSQPPANWATYITASSLSPKPIISGSTRGIRLSPNR